MTDHTPTPDKRRIAYDYMVKRWPRSHSLRFEGRCHDCKQWTLYSGQLEGDERIEARRKMRDGTVHEPCAFFCVNQGCRWSNGGSRPVVNDELEGDE